ncbi:MAG: hypothetical protein HC860_27255 [Alkalinema sp. RU_4_3]|nr:hypothetical protein [Alkalinema sp. RU_4_3]
MKLGEYFTAIKEKLGDSEIVVEIKIVDERIFRGKGYFRARLTLINGDFLEIAESFMEEAQKAITLDYRYQWMDGSRLLLRKRWDSVKHFPGLENFPHHVHILEESNVIPGVCRSIVEFIDFMESELT